MQLRHYILWFKLSASDLFAIWFSNDFQGLLLDDMSRVPVFTSADRLKEHAKFLGIELVAESPILHNLDVLCEWIRDPGAKAVDCQEFLNAWNLFVDLKSALHGRNMDLEDKEHLHVYSK